MFANEIAVLKDEIMSEGAQQIAFKNEGVADGTYFVTLSGESFVQTIPVQIIRSK